MKRMRPPDRDVELWLLLAKTRHAMLQARRKDLAQYGISPRQALILRIIHELGDGATLKEVSQSAYREIPSISTLVTRMEANGWVRKVKDMRGTTAIRYELADDGLKVLDSVLQSESIHGIISALTNGERKELNSILHKLLTRSTELTL